MTLFDRGMIGHLELPNRFVRSATGENAAHKNGTITEEFLPMYSALAKGEVGLIIGGDQYVLDEGKAGDGMTGISQDYHIEGLKQLTQAVHDACTGSKIAAQLSHSGAYSISRKVPSPRNDIDVHQMSEEDIENVIAGFRKAALRAKQAGYDAIQIHAAHGYLLSQFLSSKTNRRSDSWGRSLENRAQLLLNIYDAIRAAVGSNFPLIAKINGSDDPVQGFPVEESSQVVRMLAEDGLNGIEISGMQSDRSFKKRNEAYFALNAKKIHTQLSDLPVILVGGLRTLSTMTRLHEEFVDYISMCRPFIREPDLVQKFREGKKRADCRSCNRCLKAPTIVKCMAKRRK
jgi:2,4-dienoyl-CoA reductase-like NADH-dependent reductase (Old Yellow Enzyme family)